MTIFLVLINFVLSLIMGCGGAFLTVKITDKYFNNSITSIMVSTTIGLLLTLCISFIVNITLALYIMEV
jgi:hypothetical protein